MKVEVVIKQEIPKDLDPISQDELDDIMDAAAVPAGLIILKKFQEIREKRRRARK